MRISAITPMVSKMPKYNSPAFKSIVYQQDYMKCTDEDYELAKSKMDELAAISSKKPESNEERLLRYANLTKEGASFDYPVDIRIKGVHDVNIILPYFYTTTKVKFDPDPNSWDMEISEEPGYDKKIDWTEWLVGIDPFNFEETVDKYYASVGRGRRFIPKETLDYMDQLIVKDK